MSYRIQFTITDDEYAKLQAETSASGYPNVSEMCKAKVLGINTIADLFIVMKEKIKAIKPGDGINMQLNPGEFYLKDIINTPPALLGRWLHDGVTNGSISNVECIGIKPDKYRKISGCKDAGVHDD